MKGNGDSMEGAAEWCKHPETICNVCYVHHSTVMGNGVSQPEEELPQGDTKNQTQLNFKADGLLSSSQKNSEMLVKYFPHTNLQWPQYEGKGRGNPPGGHCVEETKGSLFWAFWWDYTSHAEAGKNAVRSSKNQESVCEIIQSTCDKTESTGAFAPSCHQRTLEGVECCQGITRHVKRKHTIINN